MCAAAVARLSSEALRVCARKRAADHYSSKNVQGKCAGRSAGTTGAAVLFLARPLWQWQWQPPVAVRQA